MQRVREILVSLLVAGGTYRERVFDPPTSRVYGSGVRAAAAVSELDSEVTLHTYVADDVSGALEVLSNTYGFLVEPRCSPEPIAFAYDYGLDEPVVSPDWRDLPSCEPVRVAGENVLRFGFVEGDAVVEGARVVYDPQSGAPDSFSDNGSLADSLAVVCNRREALALSKQENTLAAARKLAEQEGASVVVVKDGSRGALVHTLGGSTHRVPAYRTPQVWPLGSGDVFSAVFAHQWATKQMDPTEAADLASRATAWYCSGRPLPVPAKSEKLPSEAVVWNPRAACRVPKVYLAGPFFDTAQRWLIRSLRRSLMEEDIEVFSPYHDVGFGSPAEVAPKDLEAIEASDAVLAVLNGEDFGTAFEVGYARAIGKPVICLAQEVPDQHLTMAEGSGCEIVGDLPTAVYKTAWIAVTDAA